MRRLHSSLYQRDTNPGINTAYSPAMMVLDGVECFVDGALDKGTLTSPHVIVAGSDRVAIHAMGVAIGDQ